MAEGGQPIPVLIDRGRPAGDIRAMCNLYGLKATRAEVIAYFQANDDFRKEIEEAELEKDYVSPGRPGLVVREQEGRRGIDQMRWGWPPPKNAKGPVVNVRNYSSPFWKSALANPERRCLVPTTRFQEWSVEPDPETGKKRPHWFKVPSRPIFAFAGVWRPSELGNVYAFLTCGYADGPEAAPEVHKAAAASHIVGAIHPKACPVILHEEDYNRWLQAPIDDVLSLACAYPSQLMAIDS